MLILKNVACYIFFNQHQKRSRRRPVLCFSISSQEGYITWSDLHNVYNKDNALNAKLRKTPKLISKALPPGDNRQNVSLAVAIFHETTIAACESYFPDRADRSIFLKLIWWTIANSRKKLTPNFFFNNAVILNDGKIDFNKRLCDWIEFGARNSDFCLTKQTSKSFAIILRGQAMIMKELLDEGYEFIFTSRFQRAPLENRFPNINR